MMQPFKPRVLVVLAHFDESRNPKGRPNFVPQGTGHAVLAGAFNRERVQVRVYSEFHDGPLLDEEIFAWPDMLVLTGVTAAFDRMCHITAYVRAKSPRCVVVAGGPAVRNLPLSSARFFDHVCQGDVEELQALARDVFGHWAASEEMLPRFDLLNWATPVKYVETSRYCNFKCSFCALTAEGRSYSNYGHAYIESQLRSPPHKKYVLFIDNNFFGNNREAFISKLDLIGSLWREGLFEGWFALVTWDFFKDARNLDAVKSAGCLGLFSGIESLSAAQLKRYQKKQNLVVPQTETIRACLETGLVFQYGLIFDPASQSLQSIKAELDFVTGETRVPLPAFLSLAIPLLGTPLFFESIAEGRFLPSAKLRDMDGFTLLTKPLDPLEAATQFARRLAKLDGYRWRILQHCFGFYLNYRRSLANRQMAHLIANSARLALPSIKPTRDVNGKSSEDSLTYVTTTQPLGPLYTPLFRLPENMRDHFLPTMITNSAGELDDNLAANLAARAPASPPPSKRKTVFPAELREVNE